MRADRLLSTLLLLQAHGKQTGRELAKRLEVSERTVHRDMDALSAAGVPVFALRGTRGGWQLDADWRTRVPGLEEAELRALLMAQPRMIGDTRLAAAAERALDKLLASLPVALRTQAASIRQRLYVDTTGWWGSNENIAVLPVVQDAVARDRKLAIHYRRAKGEGAERTVDPLGLVAKGAVWYLVAQTPAGLRTYRVSRIEQATLLDAPSVRPPDFDLAAYWKSSTAEFMASRKRYRATLRLAPTATEKMKAWHMCAAETTDDPVDSEGWTTLGAHFEDEDQALFIVLGFGALASVVQPESLRLRVHAEVAAMAMRASHSEDALTAASQNHHAADREIAG
jgi:predicted DNA-binding transcriptional regulator YafY